LSWLVAEFPCLNSYHIRTGALLCVAVLPDICCNFDTISTLEDRTLTARVDSTGVLRYKA
jgi:hypothetical protein